MADRHQGARRAARPQSAFAAQAAATLMAATLMAATLTVTAPAAGADPHTATVTTGNGDLDVRSGPAATAARVGGVADRSTVSIVCYLRGANFSGGPYRMTTNIWNRLSTGGFVTDAMLDTGSNDPVVPLCSGGPAGPAPAARPTGKTTPKNPAQPGSPSWGAFAKWRYVSGQGVYPAVDPTPAKLADSAAAAGWSVVDAPAARALAVIPPGLPGAPADYPPEGTVAWVDTTTNRPDGQYVGLTVAGSNGSGDGEGPIAWSSRTVRHQPGMRYVLLP